MIDWLIDCDLEIDGIDDNYDNDDHLIDADDNDYNLSLSLFFSWYAVKIIMSTIENILL